LPAVMDSHAKAAGPKHLSLLANYNHALTPIIDDQVFAWLDVHLKGAPAFLTLSPVEITKDHQATWRFQGPRKAAAARLLVSYGESGNWVSRYWLEVPAQIKKETCTAVLPAASLSGFVIGTVLDEQGYAYSTPMVRIEATDKKAPSVPA